MKLIILSLLSIALLTSCQIAPKVSTTKRPMATTFAYSTAQTMAARIEPYRSAGVSGSGARGVNEQAA